MKILVDTCIWSQVLRHKQPNQALKAKLKDLIHDGRVSIIGTIRQELLSGITNAKQFNSLKKSLSAFEDIPLTTEHFEKAAEFSNMCRRKGVQGSTIDFLICAVAYVEKLEIYTTDKDFESYKKYLPIRLMER
jgi:predicted nucleic acid-binding protein